jgi:hypothetical protein
MSLSTRGNPKGEESAVAFFRENVQNPIRTMKALVHRLRTADGAEIAEAALVMPVVFIFLLGIVWFGRAFNIYSTITQAAQQGALVAARPACATCAAPTPNWSGTNFPGDAAVRTAVSNVMQASSLNPALIPPNSNPQPSIFCDTPWVPVAGVCSPSATTGNIMICRGVLINPPKDPAKPQACGTFVSFQYNFSFNLPFTSLNMTQITMNAQAQSRMEN